MMVAALAMMKAARRIFLNMGASVGVIVSLCVIDDTQRWGDCCQCGEKKEENSWYEKGCDAYWHHTLTLNLKA